MRTCSGSLSENCKELKLTLPLSRGIEATVPLDTEQVDDLITLLIQMRADMSPPVPITMPNTTTFRGVLDPYSYLETDRYGDCILMHFRHPGIGWLHFGFPVAKARAIGELMRKRAETALAARAKARRN